MKTIKQNDAIYKVSVTNGTIEIKECKVLFVGEKTAFISAPVFDNHRSELLVTLSAINTVDPSEVAKSVFYSAWADSPEKAEALRSDIEKIIEFNNQFKKSIAS